MKRRTFLAATGAVAITAVAARHAPAAAAPSRAARTAIRFAEAQTGKPYLWGGTGPDAFDCSGLVMMAYQAAGVNIPRTSQEQWAALPHIQARQLQPGDLIFYAGGDGTVDSPGHVVIFIGNGDVVQAYATGYPVMITPLASVTAGPLTGYARPRT